jgi:hypothetical protein
MQVKNDIQQTLGRLRLLVETLVAVTAMVRGSFSVVHRRCGKPSCWCARTDEKGHVSKRITWNEKQTSRIKNVSPEEESWARSDVESYQTFRQLRRELRAEEEGLEKLLDKYEDDIVKTTRKQRGF